MDAPQVENSKYPALNGSMWSIWLEFICYICIPIVYANKFNKLKVYGILSVMMMLVFLTTQMTGKNLWLPYVRLDIHHTSRLMLAFLVGGLFYLLRNKTIWNKYLSIACVVLLIIFLFFKNFAEVSLIILGGYLLFNFSLNYKNNFLNNFGTKIDISYGVYLYAWPIQIYLIKYYPQINLYLLVFVTLILASLMGYCSWTLIEKPFMQLKKKLNKRNQTNVKAL